MKPMRPDTIDTVTRAIKCGCGKIYVTISRDQNYKEVIATLGKTGSCQRAIVESLTRCITISLLYGTPEEEIIKQLWGIRCPNDSNIIPSCPQAIAIAMRDEMERKGRLIQNDDTALREAGHRKDNDDINVYEDGDEDPYP